MSRFGIPPASSLSFIDDLTGLPNRRFLRRVLDRLIDGGGPFSVLFMDLDNFKHVNDSAGHEEGDRLLRRLGELLGQSLRKRDLVARYGGDEFVILLAGGEREEAILVSEKVIASVENDLGSMWGVSASVGIACYPEHAVTGSDLISMSDNAMYAAKTSGRSCWRLAAPEGSSVFWHEDVFMARNREIEKALGILDGQDGNSLLLVTGETGSGKTSYLGVVADCLPDRRVMRIEGRPELSSIPWAALSAAIRKHSAEFPEVRMSNLWANLLGRLMPDVFGESTLTDSIMDRFALLDAFSRLLQGWAPLLCVVDDSQWLDLETVSMLGYALQTGVVSGLSVCAAFNEDERKREGSVPELLRRIPLAREVELGPLSPFQTGELIKGRLGVLRGVEGFADMVHRFSGGNPLFACEYIRTMLDAGLLTVEDGQLLPFSSPSTVPDRIRSIVGSKMRTLKPETRRVLQQASVIRKVPLDLDLLACMSGRTEGEILSSLDEGSRSGILRTGSDDSMSFYFTNEAFREEVYASAGDTSVVRYHEAAADWRLNEGDHLNGGYHLKKAGRIPEALAVYRRGAGESLRAGLPRAAVSCLEEAERLSRGLTEAQLPADELCQLKYDLLNAYRCAGDWKKTGEIAAEHADLAYELGFVQKAMSSRILAADCLRMAGDYGDALDRLIDLEPVLEGPKLADCLIREADSLSRMGRTEEALERLARAEEVLEESGPESDYLRTDLLHLRLIVSIAMEDFQDIFELSRRLLAVTESDSNCPWWYFYDIAETYLLAGDPGLSVEVFRKGIRRAEDTASLHGTLVIRAEMADALFHNLDMDGAASVLDRVDQLAGKFSEVKVLDDASLIRVQLDMESGQPETARNRINDLLCRQPGNPSIAVVNSHLLESERDFRGAHDEITRALELLDGRSMSSIIDTSVLTTMDEMRLQASWTRALLEDSDWEETALAIIPGLNRRAAFRATGLLASWLHGKGRTDEAEAVMREALGNPDWQEMRLYRYRNLIIRSQWEIDAAEEAHELISGRGTSDG